MIPFLKKFPKISFKTCTSAMHRVFRNRAHNPRLLHRKVCTGRIICTNAMQENQNDQAELFEKIKPFKWLSSKAPCFSLSAHKVK